MAIPKQIIDDKVKRIIVSVLKDIKIETLRQSAKNSLIHFYNRQYNELRRITPTKLAILIALMTLQGKDIKGLKSQILPFSLTKEKAVRYLEEQGVESANLYGVPLQKYSKEYFDKGVKPILDRLAKQYPIETDDISGRMSLRAKAELEVRYEHNQQMVQELKESGIKLVICSTHADVSERCAPWQGRVYSLDGTSGTTDDGRKFVPLETATDIYYTTKSGKTYKNGLLGFNCRHYLVPYKKGFHFPKPNIKEERKQYEITKKQRQLERNVIRWKVNAIEYKDLDKDKYEFAKKKANEWNNAYIEFSRANERAYYPSRTKIL